MERTITDEKRDELGSRIDGQFAAWQDGHPSPSAGDHVLAAQEVYGEVYDDPEDVSDDLFDAMSGVVGPSTGLEIADWLRDRASKTVAYEVSDLQCVEPDKLPKWEWITVAVTEERDSMGLPRVTVTGPTRNRVIAYVREAWGDDDAKWFADHVVARVEQVKVTA